MNEYSNGREEIYDVHDDIVTSLLKKKQTLNIHALSSHMPKFLFLPQRKPPLVYVPFAPSKSKDICINSVAIRKRERERKRIFVESLFIIRFNLMINIWLIRRKTWRERKGPKRERKLFFHASSFSSCLPRIFHSFFHRLFIAWRLKKMVFNILHSFHSLSMYPTSSLPLYHYHRPSLCLPHPVHLQHSIHLVSYK